MPIEVKKVTKFTFFIEVGGDPHEFSVEAANEVEAWARMQHDLEEAISQLRMME